MAKGGGAAAAAFIGSLVLSLAGAGLAGYFLLPIAFPGMEDTITPAFMYEEFDSTAQKNDDDLSWTVVPDTSFLMEISNNNSRIFCSFSASYLIGLSSSLGTNPVRWEVYLDVTEDIGIGKYVYIKYFDGDGSGVTGTREIGSAFSMEYCTRALDPGNYTVRVWWRSLTNSPGTNYLLFRTPSMDYNRSLSALEILA